MTLINIFDQYTQTSCYWAGFLAADGWVNDLGVIGCKLAARDRGHIEKLKAALQSNNKINYKIGIHEQVGIQITSAWLAIETLNENFSITKSKSLTLEPPPLIDECHIRNFIRGYFDGDGYLSKTSNRYIQAGFAGTPMTLEWIKFNIQNYAHVGNPSVIKHGHENVYQLIFGGKQANRILDWLYTESTSLIRLDRKYNKYQELLLWSR